MSYSQNRLLTPDLARGGMLALIAVANSALYLYARPYGLRQHIVETGLLDRIVSLLTATLVDTRAYPLFAALFAYGVAAQATPVVRRRCRWLIVFGCTHALLLFPGDVLGFYGLLGLALTCLTKVTDRTLLILATGWLAVVALIQGMAHATPPGEKRSHLWSFAIADPGTAFSLHPLEWVMTPFGIIGVVSAALAGVWAARRGLFTDPGAHRGLLIRAAAIGITLGVLGGLPTGLATGGFWTPPAGSLFALSALHAVTGVAGGLGYGALLGLLAARIGQRRGPVVTAITACGQRSLSGYLFQSVVFTLLLKPYTLALGGVLGSAGVAALALATWMISVVLAELLRRAGRTGPAEALLRRLVHGSRARRGTVRA
ncbi:DUF418 domain-containing protein [Crossiella sp. CA198]|uniref:DUF418 domain-containing protein n=1 Tax=Crossiella sp. CA198 TaxID=3455607 RepID=UPI003F8D04C7